MSWKKGQSGNPGGRKRSEATKLDALRKYIPAKKIITYLVKVVDDEEAEDRDRLMAAKILLNKVLPDQKAVEVGNADGLPFRIVVQTWKEAKKC